MTSVSFFDRVLGLQHKKTQQTVASYRELVACIAKGDEPDADKVDGLLVSVGKSVDDLKADVERYKHRFALMALVNSMPKLEAERRDIDNQIAAADRALEAAEKQHEDSTAPLYATRHELSRALSDASSAAAELVTSCDDADLRREMADLDADARRLHEQRRKANDRATYMEEKARTESERAERELSPESTEGRRDVAGRYRKEAEDARALVKRLDKATADVTKRREQVEHRMRLA